MKLLEWKKVIQGTLQLDRYPDAFDAEAAP